MRGAWLIVTLMFVAMAAAAQSDLQGIWSNATITPLERPDDLAGKPTFTAEEAAAYEKKVGDTTNFSDEYSFRGSDRNLHLTERFTRVSPDALLYEFTVDDPTAFTKPWTAQIAVTRTKGPLFEYACHEGNYAMTDILAGARAAEKKALK
jgi:hypothetical protein